MCPERRRPCLAPAYGNCQSTAPDGRWGQDGREQKTGSERLKCARRESIIQQLLASTAQRAWQRGNTQLLTEGAGALLGFETNELADAEILNETRLRPTLQLEDNRGTR